MPGLLSVVMPTFNGEPFLAAALESLLGQRDAGLELVVVDDGSTDGTIDLVERLTRGTPTRLLRPGRLGNWVAATNVGLREARGEWCCLLHQDDLWLPGRLARVRAELPLTRGALLLHDARYVDPAGASLGAWTCPLRAGDVAPQDFVERLLVQNFIAIPSPTFRRAAALDAGGLDERLWFSADWDSLAAAGGRRPGPVPPRDAGRLPAPPRVPDRLAPGGPARVGAAAGRRPGAPPGPLAGGGPPPPPCRARRSPLRDRQLGAGRRGAGDPGRLGTGGAAAGRAGPARLAPLPEGLQDRPASRGPAAAAAATGQVGDRRCRVSRRSRKREQERAPVTVAEPLAPFWSAPRLACAAIALAGTALTVAAFWPGYMSEDSFSQLAQARSGAFTALHPPLMALLWKPLDALLPGPGLLLVVQAALAWSGAALFLALVFRGWGAPVALLAFCLWPTVFSYLGTMWKDVQMGVAFLWAAALTLAAERLGWRRALWLAPVALFYGAAVRHNGITAVLPLAAWWGWVAAGLLGWRRRLAIGAAAGLALTVATWLGVKAVDGWLTRDHPVPPPEQALFIHDLIGLTGATGRLYLPEYVLRQPEARSIQWLLQLWYPHSLSPLFFAPGNLRLTSDPEKLATLRTAWLQAIADHPDIYFRHRLIMFEYLLGANTPVVHYPFHDGMVNNDLGFAFQRTPLNRLVMSGLHAVQNSLFFRGWAYLVAALALGVGGLLTRRLDAPGAALLASAFGYALPYIAACPEGDFRYLWWTVLATLLAALTLLPAPAAAPPTPAPGR